MAKVKVQHEGKEIEVELPQGYLSPTEIEAGFIAKGATEQLITDRLTRAKKSMKKELLEDEEFRTEALTTWNVKPGDGKGGKSTPDEIAAALKEHERTVVEPLKKANDSLKERVGTLTRSRLHSQLIAEASAAGVAKQYLKPLPGSKQPAVVALFEGAFGHDEQLDEWLVKQANGNWAVSGEANAAHPYKGAKHFFADLAKDPEMRSYFEPQQKGAGVDKGGGGGASVVSRDDPHAFGAAADKILKGEVTLQ